MRSAYFVLAKLNIKNSTLFDANRTIDEQIHHIVQQVTREPITDRVTSRKQDHEWILRCRVRSQFDQRWLIGTLLRTGTKKEPISHADTDSAAFVQNYRYNNLAFALDLRSELMLVQIPGKPLALSTVLAELGRLIVRAAPTIGEVAIVPRRRDLDAALLQRIRYVTRLRVNLVFPNGADDGSIFGDIHEFMKKRKSNELTLEMLGRMPYGGGVEHEIAEVQQWAKDGYAQDYVFDAELESGEKTSVSAADQLQKVVLPHNPDDESDALIEELQRRRDERHDDQ